MWDAWFGTDEQGYGAWDGDMTSAWWDQLYGAADWDFGGTLGGVDLGNLSALALDTDVAVPNLDFQFDQPAPGTAPGVTMPSLDFQVPAALEPIPATIPSLREAEALESAFGPTWGADPTATAAASPTTEQPGQPSTFSRALKSIGEGAKKIGGGLADTITGASPGKLLQAGLGLGSLGLIGAGLAKGTAKAKMPDRSRALALSPEERAAADAMAQARAKAQGTLADRGYAGEEAIRQKLNEQLMAALEGNMPLVSPRTVRRIEDQRRQLTDRLRQELGPGFATSTAGINALRNFEEYAEEVLAAEADRMRQSLHAMAFPRSQFTAQLEREPFELARAELGLLSGIGAEQARLQAGVDAANIAQAGADKRALLGLGGQLGGLAISPWLYQALWESVRPKGTTPGGAKVTR